MILLLALACGYPSYYPSPLSDAQQEIPCPVATQNLVALHITNAGSDTLEITKMEWECTELAAATLAAGEDYAEATHEGMVFIARDSQGVVDVLMVPGEGPYEWVIQ